MSSEPGPLDFWEFMTAFVFLLGMYFYYARIKNTRIKKQPEYKFFLWGLYMKLFGGLAFTLIYLYYYGGGGDTFAYFQAAEAFYNLFQISPEKYFDVLLGEPTQERYSYFTKETGRPWDFVYFDPKPLLIIRFVSVLIFFTFRSFLLTTLVVASLSYFGVWKCYQTFVRYYPELMNKLAVAILFMPSAVFWGSAILKDTFSFSGLCYFIHGVDEVFNRRRVTFMNLFYMIIGAMLMLFIKPYIFMIIFPATLFWLLYGRISKVKNVMVKYVILPVILAGAVLGNLFILTSLEGQLGKFSLQEALTTAQITKKDLLRAERYGSNSFDIGDYEPTWQGAMSKFPVATIAGLFRPFIWECNNPVMILAGLENIFLFYLFFSMLIKAWLIDWLVMLRKIPLLLLCFGFSVLYAYVVGLTTPNFGALVRFKIPLIPLFVSGCFIGIHILNIKRARKRRGLATKFSWFMVRSPLRNHKPDHKGDPNWMLTVYDP